MICIEYPNLISRRFCPWTMISPLLKKVHFIPRTKFAIHKKFVSVINGVRYFDTKGPGDEWGGVGRQILILFAKCERIYPTTAQVGAARGKRMGYSFRCEHKIFLANLKRGPSCHEAAPDFIMRIIKYGENEGKKNEMWFETSIRYLYLRGKK